VSLTAVVMAAPDPKIRFSQAASLLDYGFANCTGFEDQTTALKLPAILVKNGVSETVIPYISKDFSYTLCKGESGDQIKRRIEYKKDLTAPIRKGDMIGRIVYTMNNQTLEEIPVYAARNVSKATYTDCLGKLLKRWFVA
jgi:serine-type D-Ala-D-Ala carboxypeptidase (penicillin-binding protein 5/6)